jgi:hypothetical protein
MRTRGKCAKQSQTWAGWDIWGTTRQEGANRAKQTQFARRCRVGRGLGGVGRGELCETNPISPERPGMGAGGRGREAPPGTDYAKRTQFGPAWAGPGPRWAKDAKRTQFRELAGGWNTHHSTIPSFHHSSPMPIVRNKANPGGAGWDGASGTRGARAKQTQFRRVRLGAGGRLRETKPMAGLPP